MVSKARFGAGIGVMALLLQATPTWAKAPGEDLARLLQSQGIRQSVELETRDELRPVFEDGVSRGRSLAPECEPVGMFEIALRWKRSLGVTAGYEVYLECEDSAAPGVGLYYDGNGEFLAALAYGD